jgi:hypothetical protein
MFNHILKEHQGYAPASHFNYYSIENYRKQITPTKQLCSIVLKKSVSHAYI